MWELEYLLLFGLPGNKWELWDGYMYCRFPFSEPAAAEAHWELWRETLCRWQGVDHELRIKPTQGRQQAKIGDFLFTRYPQPINLDVPIDGEALEAIHDASGRRDFWDQQPLGYGTGYDPLGAHGEVKMNLWSLFRVTRREAWRAGELCRHRAQRDGGRRTGHLLLRQVRRAMHDRPRLFLGSA
jgi:hypothetical protein